MAKIIFRGYIDRNGTEYSPHQLPEKVKSIISKILIEAYKQHHKSLPKT